MRQDSSNYDELKNLVQEAKRKLGKKAIEIIAEDLKLEDIQAGKSKSICPFHDDHDASLEAYPDQGSFYCFGCNKHYDIIDHYIEFNKLTFLEATQKLFDLTDTKYNFLNLGKKQKRDYIYPKYDKSDDRTKVEEYLGKRKISKSTLDHCDVQQSEKGGHIVFNYYDESDVLTSVKYRPARKIRNGDTKCWFQPNADNRMTLFNMNRVDPNKPLVITEGECFPGDAEILTPNGWVELQNYNNQKVMSVNEDMTGEFVTPLAYIKKEYSGKLMSVHRGGNYFIETTPDHNVVYFYKYKNKYELKKQKIKDISNLYSYNHVPTTVKYGGAGLSLSNDQIALFIAVSADGTLYDRKTSDNVYVNIQFKKQRKIERFEKILKNNGISYTKTNPPKNRDQTYFGFTAPEWLTTKMFPMEWISQMSLDQKEFLISEIVHWDGNHVPNRNQIEYSSREIHNATFIQTIAHTAGYMSTIMHRSNKWGSWYKVSILFGKNYVTWQNVVKNKDKTVRQYEGLVYCVQVPSGMILIRQKEKISVIGNCDALSLIECGVTNSVSVPNGAGNTKWIEENFEWLEQFDKIIVWADSDPAGIKMRKEACSRLGTWRTFYVDIPEELQKYEDPKDNKKWDVKDINEILYWYGKEKVRDLLDNAQEMPIEGISDLAMVDDFDIETAEGLTPKIGVLKNVLYKFLFGSVVLVTGYPGAGKSTMVNQLFVCDALQEGRDVFLFSDELSAPVVRSWFEWTLAGPEFVKTKDEFVHIVDPSAKKKMREWYKEHVWIYNDLSNKSEDILNKAIAVTRKYGVKVWVLDNLMSMDLGANGKDIYEAQKNFIVKLNKLAIEYGVLAVLVAHPRKYAKGEDMETQDISGSSDLGNRAQYIIGIRRFKETEQRKGQHNYDQEISILKNRYTGRLGKPKVYFDYDSYRFYKNYQKELYMRYGWDDPNRSTVYQDKHIEKHEGPYGMSGGQQPF